MAAIRISRGRPSRIVQLAIAAALLAAQAGVMLSRGVAPPADAAPSIGQVHYTPFEAQVFIDVLRSLAGAGCCSGSVESAVSITSGADANTVVYDHFEDGYEADPFDPQQASTITLTMNRGQVWTQSSSVPIDPRGVGVFFDGRDKIVSTAPIAMTQTAYASTPGSVHAGGVQVMDLDRSGTSFRVPIGQDADLNQVFEYVGLIVVGTAGGTTVDVDADADGIAETTLSLGEGEVAVVDGGVNLGASLIADAPVSVYLASGDVDANYEGRFIELFPTRAWTGSYISPVGAHSSATGDGTRVFLFNPGAVPIDVDVVEGGGSTTSLTVPAGGQASHLMPVDAGARFTSTDGSPFYALQAVTTEGTSTAAYDWGFTLIPEASATPIVVVPYGPGSAGATNNYSPLWVSPSADTTLYIDLDGDPATGSATDPAGNLYDFSCSVTALASITIYDDGSGTCYSPSQDAAAGGDRDLTGARVYTADGTRLSAAWGQRSSYITGNPALDMGTTILPYPALRVAKSVAVTGDLDGDGEADPGDTLTYTVSVQNEGIVDVYDATVVDEVPEHTSYVSGSTTLDGAPQPDDSVPFSPFPVDTDSPAGLFEVGTVAAGGTTELAYSMLIDSPTPYGVTTISNRAVIASEYGESTVINVVRLDLPPLQISKASTPSQSPVAAGDTIDYTIRVFNGDVLTHTGVAVTDPLPPGTSYVPGSVSADVDGTPVAAAAPPDLIAGLTLDEGQVLTVDFRVRADAPLPAGITEFANTASAVSDQHPDPVAASVADPADPLADLSLAKDDGSPGVLRPGDPLGYTLTVTNNGPDEASAVEIVDTLPAGVTLDAAGTDASCTEGPVGTVTCLLGDLAPGSASVTIAVTVDAGIDGILTNQATVSSATPDPNPGDETASVDTVVDELPALAVSKSAAPGSLPEPGGTVTFSVVVSNPTSEALVLTSLSDDVFGDLLDPGNGDVAANTCPSQPMSIPPGGGFACTFEALLIGNGSDPVHTDVVTAAVTDDEGNAATETDAAVVSFTDVVPTLAVTKTPSATEVDEPGATVTFTVEVENTAVEAVTLVALADDVFGDLLDAGNPAVAANTCPAAASASLPAGSVLSCTFEADVTGDASGPDHLDTVTATVADDEGNVVTGDGAASISFADVTPAIAVAKTPSPASVPEPGGDVTFTVEVTNTGPESLTITGLTDDVFGDLLDTTNPGVSFNDCPAQALTLAAGATMSCAFDASLAGSSAGPAHADTVTAAVADDDGNTASETATATVPFIDVLPSVEVGKSASEVAVDEPGATVTFTVTVDNTGTVPVTLTALSDDVFGDLLDAGNGLVEANTCPSQPAAIPAGGSVSCSFEAYVAGDASDPDHVDTITAAVVDGDGDVAEGSASATIAFDPITAEMRGHLFVDLDGDAAQGPGEPDLPGIDLMIIDGVGTVTTVTSDAGGDWTVTARFGTATISVLAGTVPEGYELTTANALQVVEVVRGVLTQTEDIGYRPADASIAGVLFLDLDGDDVRDDDDPLLPGVRVVAIDGAGNQVGEAVTGLAGGYLLEGIRPGEVTIRLDAGTVPDGLAASWDLDGIADRITVVIPGPGDIVTGVDFAERGTGSIGDTVWIDTDRDGAYDSGEEALQGVAVALVWAGFDGEFGTGDDVHFGERASDGAGSYRFANLPPGAYRVSADLTTAGSAMTATTDLEIDLVLGAGSQALFADYGFAVAQSLARTGFDLWPMLLAAVGMVGSGGLLIGGSLFWERRRRAAGGMRRSRVHPSDG